MKEEKERRMDEWKEGKTDGLINLENLPQNSTMPNPTNPPSLLR
jgi:hypothetical protein